MSGAESLYRSSAGSHFYGTEYEIWADFVPVGNTEKKIGADYEQLLRVFFHVFRGEKIIICFNNRPKTFFQYYQPVQNQLKSHILFHKNGSLPQYGQGQF